MKKLTKIRLINWHYFANETINVKNNMLITGQNATGKSTIVDAVAFILTAGDQIFNLAANEKSKRDLRGYVKCKLGIDNQEYLRSGDTTGHVALEFFDERTSKSFTVGAVIDVFGEITPPKVLFYSADRKIGDDLFIDAEHRILTTLNFKKAKLAEDIYLTRREAKLAFRSKFGSINETYFSLLPKALAFKPIGDVKEFIYHYLLEEKTLDVESIKESIHSYRDLEGTLKVIKAKIADLQDMKGTFEEIQKNQEAKRFYEYLLKVIDLENNRHQILGKTQWVEKLGISAERFRKDIAELDRQIEAADDRGKEIYALLQSDESFKAGQVFDRDISNKTTQTEDQKEIVRYYLAKVGKVKPLIEELKAEFPDKLYEELARIDLANVTAENVDKVKFALAELERQLRDRTDANIKQIGKAEIEKNNLLGQINDIFLTLKDLENHKLRYNPAVKELQAKIEEGVSQRYGVAISVHILAELLEVADKKWQDTIEDYLGPQRFNLIVEPRYFDEALQVFNRLKNTMNVYGIGLVNTKKIASYVNCQPNSLASILLTDNVDAKHYVNMTCGNVIMVKDVTELENFNSAITVDGVLYSRFTVRTLNKNTEKPFLGKNAQSEQLAKWKEQAIATRAEYNRVVDRMNRLNEENNLIAQLGLRELLERCSCNAVLTGYVRQLEDLKKKKAALPTDNLNELRVEYEHSRDEIKALETNKRHLYEETGKIRSDQIKAQEDILALENRQKEILADMETLAAGSLTIGQEADAVYRKEIAEAKDPVKVETDYRKRIEAQLTNLTNLEDSLKQKQLKYTNAYNLGYPFGIDHMHFYVDELTKLIKSELVKYESKVREAREAAEKLFKEDFIAKLRNYIVSAQDEIAKINATLQAIHFGDDTYEFIFPKSREYSDYYDMVLSDESMRTGGEIFNYDFEMKYERQLEELFINLAQDDLNSNGAINKFTDYRTYMDYDIKIINRNQDVTMYSKVFKEKSGGETQVPFYVATLASFVRLFQQASRGGMSDAIGLILFDEVFDKMDTTRIRAMMEFVNQLPVQIILATPPQKMEVLSKFTDTTVVTLRDGKAARVYEVVEKD